MDVASKVTLDVAALENYLHQPPVFLGTEAKL